MNIPDFRKVHNRFKLDGVSCNREDLKDVGYSYIKEGEAFEQSIGIFLLDWLDEREVITVTSSGTTGGPKVLEVSKQAMVNSAVRTAEFFNLPIGAKALLCLPVDFIAGKMMLVRALVLGLELDIIPPRLNPEVPADTRYDFVAMIPQQAAHCLPFIHRFKTLLIGGAAIPQKLRHVLVKHPGCYETYGMTETLTHIALAPVSDPPSPFKTLEGIRVSQSEEGCLNISAPHITDELIKTNDLVNCLDEQTFYFLGRKDHVINSGGRKLFPEQIERILAEQIHLPFFVTKQKDTTFGEAPVLIIEGTEKEWPPQSLDNLHGLDKYEHPKAVFYFTQFDRTSSGKIKRDEIRRALNL
jgi:O-succinylbenzoic acid--CoA ligase